MTTSDTANSAFASRLKKLLLRPFPALFLAAPLLMLTAALLLSAAPFSPAVTAPAGEAGAQSPDGPPRGDGQGAPGTGDGIDAPIKARTLEEATVPPGTVAALGLRLSDVQGSHPALKRGDAVLKGHARSVEYEGRLIGQIVVASVAIGEAEVAIQADPLAAQFDLEEALSQARGELLRASAWRPRIARGRHARSTGFPPGGKQTARPDRRLRIRGFSDGSQRHRIQRPQFFRSANIRRGHVRTAGYIPPQFIDR